MTAGLSFTNLLIVAVVAVVAPLASTLLPVRVPSVVLEIVTGIVIGPAVLRWVEVDQPVAVLALVGLAFLLFLAGLEIDVRGLHGDLLRLPLIGFGLTLALGCAFGLGASAIGWVDNPLFLAVTLGATSLGIVAPLLKDTGTASHPVGQFTLAGATIADFSTILLLSLVFSAEGGSATSRLVSIALFTAAIVALAVAIGRAGRSVQIDELLVRLQDTTAAIRVRIAVALLLGFVAIAARAGLETILGAFIAGAVLSLVDRDMASHPHFRLKLESIGFGLLIPVFFIASGARFDLRSLTDQPSALLRVPVFLVAMLVIRGAPALLYRRAIGTAPAITVGLLHATSLPFIVTATQIGVEIGAVAPTTAAALVSAGLMSTVLFPAVALNRLSTVTDRPTPDPPEVVARLG